MRIISVLTWVASHKCIALCYADEASDLITKVDDTELVNGSLAYTADGSVYVLGDDWTKVGA